MAPRVALTVLQRLEAVEEFSRTQGTSISSIVTDAMETKARMRELERESSEAALSRAREDERDKALYERLASMEKGFNARLSRIEGTGAKALWIFVSAILLAAAAFIIRGGLSI